MACTGERTVRVNNSFVGFGTTKDEALADLLDRIAEAAEGEGLNCRRETCEAGTCQPSVDLEDLENGRTVRYGRAGGSWKAFVFGRNQGGLSANVPAYCSCAPAQEDGEGVVFQDISDLATLASFRADAGLGLESLRARRAALASAQFAAGQRCGPGMVTGIARNVKATKPKKEDAEAEAKNAARASAAADAQTKCAKATCSGRGQACTFDQTFEAIASMSTASRDPNGNIVWTCTVSLCQVFGVCVCKKPAPKPKSPKKPAAGGKARRSKKG